MNEWRSMHNLNTATLTSALSTMSAQLTSIITPTPMSTSTEASTVETSVRMKEARSRENKTRYISGKLVTVQKMSTSIGASNAGKSMTMKEATTRHVVGDSGSFDNSNNQNCCTVLLTDSGKVCTKL